MNYTIKDVITKATIAEEKPFVGIILTSDEVKVTISYTGKDKQIKLNFYEEIDDQVQGQVQIAPLAEITPNKLRQMFDSFDPKSDMGKVIQEHVVPLWFKE